MIPGDFAMGMSLGFALDLLIGWPAGLYARIGHPVGWLAAPVIWLEKRLNGPERSDAARLVAGTIVSIGAILAAALIWGMLAAVVTALPFGAALQGLLFWPLIAARSMHDHVAAVGRPLSQGDLTGARAAVSMIVGRDPEALDEAGIARATLESLAENTSDGVTAPIFWGLVLGPAGMAAYKAINTLDSMIGHRNSRYEWFGKTAARIDDIVNLIPARLTGLLYALAGGRAAQAAWRIMWRDAGRHRSPNAGWPEAALAGALGLRLSGPRIYGPHVVDEPWLNPSAPDPVAADIGRGLRLYRRVLALLVIGLVLVWLAG